MTISEVIDKLMAEYWKDTEDVQNYATVRKYIQRALVIGMEHFDTNMNEIVVLNQWGVVVGRYKSESEASTKLGIPQGNINNVLKKRTLTAGGFNFVKAKNYDLKKPHFLNLMTVPNRTL